MRRRVRAPELTGRGWLNTGGGSVSLAGLRGKIVLVDFWTFCCINCLHVLDELRPLENKFSDVLVTIGVHSPKFDHEKDAAALADAVERYGVTHAVLDDPEMTTWYQYGARAWPTLGVVDPEGYLVAMVSGEGHAAALADLIADLIEEHEAKGTLHRGDGPYVAPEPTDTVLRFPAKGIITSQGGLLVSSAAQHQIVELAPDAQTVVRRIGTGVRGMRDGHISNAQFSEPHGLLRLPAETAVKVGYDVVIADTVNHSLRGLRTETGDVITIAGTGEQLREPMRPGWHEALGTDLTSPWDLAWFDNMVIIAMAGWHQLWWFDPVSATVGVYCGTGAESLHDGPLLSAAMAQPSGLAVSGERLWIADSETSALRWIEHDRIRTAVGQGLFDFGLVDGPGADALLQHPLGVGALADGSVLVADTYNGAVRRYRPDTGVLSTVATGLSEPSDIVLTENGDVLVVESAAHRITQLASSLVGNDVEVLERDRLVQPGELLLDVDFVVPAGRKLDNTYGSAVQLTVNADKASLLDEGAGSSAELHRRLVFSSKVTDGVLTISARVATCDDGVENPACHITRRTWTIPVHVTAAGESQLSLALR